MSMLTIAAGLVLGLATAGLLAYAGDVVRRRPLSPPDRAAGLLYAVWWYSAALVILNQALRTLLVLAGVQQRAVYLAQGLLGMIPLAAAVWGLSFYMVYLLTGRRGWLAPITLFYIAYLVFLFWYVLYQGVAGVGLDAWQSAVRPERPPSASMNLVFGVWLAGPVLLAVVSYMVLAVREKDRTRRYRLSLVSGGFVLLFSIILVGYVLGWVDEDWFPIAYEVPALIASALAVAAYRPPVWVQRWLRIEPLPSAQLLQR